MRYCPKCKTETGRYSSGDCKPCAIARANAYCVANPAKVKAQQAAKYIANIDKARAYGAIYRAVNTEKAREYRIAYYVANLDKIKANNTAWRAANSDWVKARSSAWRAANIDKCKEYNVAWVNKNRKKKNATNAAWKKKNRESNLINVHNRNARKRANGGVLSKGLSDRLYKLQRGLCPCCKLPLGSDFHLDHIVPVKLGGSNTDDNMQLLRATCNLQKSAKDPIVFMQSRGFLL